MFINAICIIFFIFTIQNLCVGLERTWRSNCPQAYLYETYMYKGCTAVLKRNGCPRYFDCSNVGKPKKCYFDGKFYEAGEIMKLLCATCICRGPGDKHSRYIYADPEDLVYTFDCEFPDCNPKPKEPEKICVSTVNPGTCCLDRMCYTKEEMETQPKCRYEGGEYMIGERIPFPGNKCKRCVCTGNSTEVKCESLERPLEPYDVYKLRKGCLHLHHQYSNRCYGARWCEDFEDVEPVIGEGDPATMCQYHGKFYERGTAAIIKSGSYTYECKCSVPPDFFCVFIRAEFL